MAKIDKTVHELYKEILTNGFKYKDPNRKGVHRIEIPSYTIEHTFSDGFPAITTKKLYWKGVVGENLWILRGDTNIKYLLDNDINIWNKDAYNYYLKQCKTYNVKPVNNQEFIYHVKNKTGRSVFGNNNYKLGDLGRVYGYQLRNFGGKFDQLKWLINELKNNPLSTKKDITYINPCDKNFQALTPCHTGWSIAMNKNLSGFWLEFNMGSSDSFHGLPFNLAGYGLLAKIVEKVTGYKAIGIRYHGDNVHIYEPHLEAVKKQLSNDVNKYGECELEDFAGFKMDMRGDIDQWLSSKEISDFTLSQYSSDPRIPAEMLAYNK